MKHGMIALIAGGLFCAASGQTINPPATASSWTQLSDEQLRQAEWKERRAQDLELMLAELRPEDWERQLAAVAPSLEQAVRETQSWRDQWLLADAGTSPLASPAGTESMLELHRQLTRAEDDLHRLQAQERVFRIGLHRARSCSDADRFAMREEAGRLRRESSQHRETARTFNSRMDNQRLLRQVEDDLRYTNRLSVTPPLPPFPSRNSNRPAVANPENLDPRPRVIPQPRPIPQSLPNPR